MDGAYKLHDIDQISLMSNIMHTQIVHGGLLGKSWLFSASSFPGWHDVPCELLR